MSNKDEILSLLAEGRVEEAEDAIRLGLLSGEETEEVARALDAVKSGTTDSGLVTDAAAADATVGDDTEDVDEPDLESLTVAQLKDLAEEREVDLDPTARKAEIIEALQDAEADD